MRTSVGLPKVSSWARLSVAAAVAVVALLAVQVVTSVAPSDVAHAATIDGNFNQLGPIGAGAVFDLPVLGRGGVPASGVGSVALNVTVTRPTATSFLTVWPTGQPRPNASNLNFTAGQTVPNMVIVPIGAGGQISIFNESGTTDVLVDVLGWFPIGPSFTGLTPARLLDSRVPSGGTVDGAFNGIGQFGGGTVFDLPVSGRGGLPASGVGSIALNVTVARPSATSFLTVWPTGQPRPNASNLNFTAGQTVPNMVIVPVGVGGQISIFNESGTTDVLVDVLGWFPVGPSFTGLTPARLIDTRIPSGGTVDGGFTGIGPLAGGSVFNLPVVSRGGVPASGVGSVALNVTVARPSEAGFLTVWPTGQPRPNASNLNFTPGKTVPNMVIVPIGAGGQISIVNESGTADVLVDVLGWFPVGPSFTGLTPARLMDTRIPPGLSFEDQFDGNLRTGWQWLAAGVTRWSLTEVPGTLRIVAASPPGAVNALVRAAPGSNFEMTTVLRFQPTSNFQFAGLVVYESPTNFLQLGRSYCDTPSVCLGDGIYFDSVVAGSFTGANFSLPLSTSADIHLRIRAEGATYTASYSTDGNNWIRLGSHARSLAAPQIGLVAHQTATDVVAGFEYFKVSVLGQ